MKKLIYITAFLLLLAGAAIAQPVDLERTLPDLVGTSDEDVRGALGRPDHVWAGQTIMSFRYTRWRTWSVTLFFKPSGGKWVVYNYSLHRTSGVRHHPISVRP